MGERQSLMVIDDGALLREIGNQKTLNTVLLSCAICLEVLSIPLSDFKAAVVHSVKPAFTEINVRAIEIAQDFIASKDLTRKED